jgi:hypothetical protein
MDNAMVESLSWAARCLGAAFFVVALFVAALGAVLPLVRRWPWCSYAPTCTGSSRRRWSVAWCWRSRTPLARAPWWNYRTCSGAWRSTPSARSPSASTRAASSRRRPCPGSPPRVFDAASPAVWNEDR